jgi:hypothetical protein
MLSIKTVKYFLFTIWLKTPAITLSALPMTTPCFFIAQQNAEQKSLQQSLITENNLYINFTHEDCSNIKKIEPRKSTISLSLPYIRVATRKAVEANAITFSYKFVDANTGKVIEETRSNTDHFYEAPSDVFCGIGQ